jgi:hypothetical protein
MRITNSQKKQLSDIFNNHELNLLDFEVSGNYHEFKVKFKFDYFSFTVVKKDERQFQVTIFSVENTRGGTGIMEWDDVLHRFELWSAQIKIELDTPNGWETFQSRNYLNTNFNDLNQFFTEDDKLSARRSLSEIKQKLKTLDITVERLEIMEGKLDELGLKVDHLTKFDWKSLFIGTIANLIMSLAIPPESAGMLWEWIKSAFNGLKLKG